MKTDRNLRLISTKNRSTQFDDFAHQPWYIRWFLIGIALLLWAGIINLLIFGYVFL